MICRSEASAGYALPRDHQIGTSSRALDSHFHNRFVFFRSIRILSEQNELLSIGTVLSLTFRFENFAVEKIPVMKFNSMHWRRMLPWISNTTAEQLQTYFVPRSIQ